MKEKIKVAILLGAEFIAIAIILLLIFFAGKKSYTVTFDLNGGTLIAGDVEQRVTQGHSANPPQVVKDGHYFLRWSGSYNEITHDTTLVAIWEYETTPGIEYSDSEFSNYCEIVSGYKGLSGDVYVGAYYNNKKALGIREGAFKNCVDIENMYLLDGVLRIDREAFSGCVNLETIDLPSTTVVIDEFAFIDCLSLTDLQLPKDLQRIGAHAFENCESLERIIIPEGVTSIGEGAFKGCTSLTEVVLPSTIEEIGEGAFDADVTVIYVCMEEDELPEELGENWHDAETEFVFGADAIAFREKAKINTTKTEE